MLQKEFEQLLGRKVSENEFENANHVYMCLPTTDKDEFAHMWDKNKNHELAFALTSRIYQLEDYRDSLLEERERAITELQETRLLASQIATAALFEVRNPSGTTPLATTRELCIKAMGQNEYVKYCLQNGMDLSEEDRKFLVSIL